MKKSLTFENAHAVTLYKESDSGDGSFEPFEWVEIISKNKDYFVVLGMRFSYKTGKPLKGNSAYCNYIWRKPFVGELVEIPYEDVVVKAEPFDLDARDIIEVENERISVAFNEGESIREGLNAIEEELIRLDIPDNAEIKEVLNNYVVVSYKRLETLRERTSRLYFHPALEKDKERARQEKLESERQRLLQDLESVDSQLEAKRN